MSTTLQRGAALRGQYARILANFRSKRLRKVRSVNRHVQPVQSLEILKSSVVAQDQKSLTGLVGILDTDVLWEHTDEDSCLRLMKRALVNRDYEGFCRIDSYLKSFRHCAAVVDGCVVVDNRIAIPNCLRKPSLARLHRSHAVQLAMVDAAQYIWWPRMHRDIVQLCKDCPQCTKFGKNLTLPNLYPFYLVLMKSFSPIMRVLYSILMVTVFISWSRSTDTLNIRQL